MDVNHKKTLSPFHKALTIYCDYKGTVSSGGYRTEIYITEFRLYLKHRSVLMFYLC